jgi:hypothetical protein
VADAEAIRAAVLIPGGARAAAPTGGREDGNYPVTGVELLCLWPHRRHLPSDLVPQDEVPPDPPPKQPVSNGEVVVAHAAGPHPDEHLVWAHLGLRNVEKTQAGQRARRFKDYCFHGRAPPLLEQGYGSPGIVASK